MSTLRKALNRIWASSPVAGIVPLSDEKYNLGWVAEIPAFQHLNWLHNTMDTNVLALAERGIFEYGSDVTYAKGALVWREADGFIYIALVANPTTPPPSLQWERSCAQLSREEFEGLIVDWQAHIDNKENPHDTTAVQVGAVPATGGTYTGNVGHTSIRFGGAAGKSSFVEDADGSSWIYDGVKMFNISPAGTPRTFFSGAWQQFLYKENYVAARTEYENLFALPPADVDVPMTYTLHPTESSAAISVDYLRAGTLAYTNKLGQSVSAPANTPAFGRRGLVLSKKDTQLTELQLPTDKLFTLCCTVHRMSGTTINTATVINFDNSLQIVYEGGQVHVYFDGALKLAAGQSSAAETVVFVCDGVESKLFLNGVLRGTIAETPVIGTEALFIGNTGDTATNAQLTNFKFWYNALTDEQIKSI